METVSLIGLSKEDAQKSKTWMIARVFLYWIVWFIQLIPSSFSTLKKSNIRSRGKIKGDFV